MTILILSRGQSARVEKAQLLPAREREAEIMAVYTEAAESPAPVVAAGVWDFLAVRLLEVTVATLFCLLLLAALLVFS